MGRDFKKTRSEDRQSTLSRSRQMKKIRSSGTQLEKLVLEAMKSSIDTPFSLNEKSVKGKPDIVFFEQKICVFIDSDFWHGWQFPRWKHTLKNEFWINKIHNNRVRDRRVTQYLRRNGWLVIRIWEHNIYLDIEGQVKRIIDALSIAQTRSLENC